MTRGKLINLSDPEMSQINTLMGIPNGPRHVHKTDREGEMTVEKEKPRIIPKDQVNCNKPEEINYRMERSGKGREGGPSGRSHIEM